MPETLRRGAIYAQADRFVDALAAREEVASAQMLTAWSDTYWRARAELDALLARLEAARAAGEAPGVSWAYQEGRLRTLLGVVEREVETYAASAASATAQVQLAGVRAGARDSLALTEAAVTRGLPGLDATFLQGNTAVLEAGVGFLADGSVLREHLAATLPGDTADAVRKALLHGLATGKSQDWMVREATRAYGLSHTRAVTIMRTESLRAYRAASRATYAANAELVPTWTWSAHLDSRCCLACVLMDGTEHPVGATLDGHPRCRCAMVPRTTSWEDLLGEDGKGLPDTRPPVRSGKAWLEAQGPDVQRAMMGPRKYAAWRDGEVGLDDMVARPYSERWGTMRTERSLTAIREGRDANYFDGDAARRA